MASGDTKTVCTGRALAQVLAGCWRPEPPPLELAPALHGARLAELSPLLDGSGAGALVWRRLRDSAWRKHSGADLLHQAHVRQALDAWLQERKIEKILLLLQEHGIEPLLVKGWACARTYPEPGLRPLGDVDLVVPPWQCALAAELLGVPFDSDESEGGFVDLKSRLRPIYGLELDEAMAAARRVPFGRASLWLLSPEHHLRLLCLHFLRHGAWRPLWLCDIGAVLEARPANFDWDRCLGRDKRRRDCVACALGLAHLLLDAQIAGTPAESRARRLPAWLVPTVLRQWATPMLSQHAVHPLMAGTPHRLGPLLHAMKLRWPNPIEASVTLRMPLNVHPLAAQMIFYARTCLHYLSKSLGGPRRSARGQ